MQQAPFVCSSGWTENVAEDRFLARSNWSRQLPRPLIIPDIMTLKTLAGVRTIVSHLPIQLY